jgi:hypothetical protein
VSAVVHLFGYLAGLFGFIRVNPLFPCEPCSNFMLLAFFPALIVNFQLSINNLFSLAPAFNALPAHRRTSFDNYVILQFCNGISIQ